MRSCLARRCNDAVRCGRKEVANSSTTRSRWTFSLTFSRRTFLRSLRRTALVLPLEGGLRMARPGFGSAWAVQTGATQSGATQSGAAAVIPKFPAPAPWSDLHISFVDVAKQAGLNAKTIFGGENKNKYLLETTGCGVAFYDCDNDGWPDIFLVNGSRLEGFPKGEEPHCHLFKNNRDGTFTDVTQ